MNEEHQKHKALLFFEEKGFYIVLLLCAVAIGTAAWVLFAAPEASDEPVLQEPVFTTAAPVMQQQDAQPAANLDTVGKDEQTVKTDSQTIPKQSTLAVPQTTAAQTVPKRSTLAAVPKTTAAKPAPATSAAKPAQKTADFFVKPVSGEVHQVFSGDELVYDRTNGDWRTHNGVDFLCADGDKVMVIADGTVKDIYNDDYYGTSVLVDHGDGLQSVYLGLLTEATVSKGQEVKAGEIIGAVDADVLFEASLPVHFHLEVLKNGVRIDPMELLEG